LRLANKYRVYCNTEYLINKFLKVAVLFVIVNYITIIDDSKRTNKGEFDGFSLFWTGKDLRVLLVEAKQQKVSCTSKAKKQLTNLINEIKFKTSDSDSREIKEIKGGCYCYLKIDENFL